jgi:hypothetical protein
VHTLLDSQVCITSARIGTIYNLISAEKAVNVSGTEIGTSLMTVNMNFFIPQIIRTCDNYRAIVPAAENCSIVTFIRIKEQMLESAICFQAGDRFLRRAETIALC